MHPLPFRQIHLDFHTSPAIRGIGANFNPEEFASVLAEARVESVTLFAKCHHGHLYFDTAHPSRHPHLSGDLLSWQIEALRGRGIRCPIYLSVQCDEYAVEQHPEWRVVERDGSMPGWKPQPEGQHVGWRIVDMASPYADYLEEQVVEVMKRFAPVDGLFFDMCWDQVSFSKWALDKMKAWHLRALDERDQALYARRVANEYMERYFQVVARLQKDVPLWFNSRPLIRLKDEIRYLQHVEVEALPTGGWGYAYLPIHIRYTKTLGRPMLGMTGRFHKSWADFGGLRTVPAILYDCAQALAHGAGCSIGDQLHPSGRIDKAVYQVIGDVYRHVERSEPWVKGATFPREIAVLYRDPASHPLADAVHEGVMRALTQLRHQFVFLTADDAWEEYALVIVPETIERDDTLEARLSAYKAKGGSVLSEDLRGEPSRFSCVYLRFSAAARSSHPATDHVFYERGALMQAREGDDVLARIVEPYFERTWEHFCSHAQTPPGLEVSDYVAGVVRGREAILALPVFRAYARHANLPCRELIAAALSRVLPEPSLRMEGPSYVEAVIADQPGRRVVHLLSFIPQKRTPALEIVEEGVPARNLAFDLKVDGTVRRVSLQPQDQDLSFEMVDGRVRFHLDWMEGHQMVVAEQ